jgi:hypothetical protein
VDRAKAIITIITTTITTDCFPDFSLAVDGEPKIFHHEEHEAVFLF